MIMVFFCRVPSARRVLLSLLLGGLSVFVLLGTLVSPLLHSRTRFQHVLVDNDCKVTDYVFVELENLLELGNHIRRGFMKKLNVEPCVLLLYGIREASSSPAINGRNFSAVFRNEFLVPGNCSLNLAVLQV